MQVAVSSSRMDVSHVCTLDTALVGTRKHHQPRLQIMLTASASEIFVLIDGRKNTTSASCRGSRPSWALVGAGCSNQMQVAQGQGPVRVCALAQGVLGCCILLLLLLQAHAMANENVHGHG